MGLAWWLREERICLQCRRPRFDPWVRKIPWRKEWLHTPVFLSGEFHGQRSLAGINVWSSQTLLLLSSPFMWFCSNSCHCLQFKQLSCQFQIPNSWGTTGMDLVWVTCSSCTKSRAKRCGRTVLTWHRDSHTLLLGMRNGTATLEDCLEVSYKTKYTLPIQPRNRAPCNLPNFFSHLPTFFTTNILHMNVSVQFSCSVVSDSLQPHGLQHTRLPCSSPTPRVCSNSCPLSQWCHPTISSSIVPFSFHLQSFPESGSFPVSQLFASGSQSLGALASASVLPMNSQAWFPLRLSGLISLQFKGLSRVFSNTTVQ